MAFFMKNPVKHASPEIIIYLSSDRNRLSIIQVVKHTADPQSVHSHPISFEIPAIFTIRRNIIRVYDRHGIPALRNPKGNLMTEAFISHFTLPAKAMRKIERDGFVIKFRLHLFFYL